MTWLRLLCATLLGTVTVASGQTYDAVIAVDTPCHLYRLQETAGTTAVDTPYRGDCRIAEADATYVNTPSLNQASTGILGKVSVAFNGSDEYARFTEMLGGCKLSLTAGDWSWEAWGRVHGNGSVGTNEGGAFSSYESTKSSWALFIGRSGKVASFEAFTTLGGSYLTAAASTAVVLDTWYHVVATWSLSTTTLKLYINGALETTATTPSGSAGCGEMIDIGRLGYTPSGGTNYLNGNVQYAAIYEYVLPAARVLAHYTCGATGACGADPSVFGYRRFIQ